MLLYPGEPLVINGKIRLPSIDSGLIFRGVEVAFKAGLTVYNIKKGGGV